MIGTSVDRYEILEELGHGGMSVVYRGLDSSLEREVAVKVLHNHLAKKLENRRRFHREAKAIARLRHPNILEIYDFSSEDAQRSYIVMEYVAGENLRQFVARTGTPPPEIAALIGVEICNALEHAHDHGIIHRDLKPENVMVSSGGELKLMDFGIAHVIDAETMTATGSLMGSPAHMAPELIDGEKVDVRADVFALGTVIYWLATGSLPFDGANAPQVLKRVLAGDYDQPEVLEPKVGRQLAAIITRCLAHDPDDRFPTVMAVRAELDRFAATMGLSEVRTELKKYFIDPDATRAEFESFVVERLTQQAAQAQRNRDIPGAIAHFNRILAYDPSNREVQRMLDRLCRQDRWRRLAPPVVLGVITVAGLAAFLLTRPPTPPEPGPEPSFSPEIATNAAAVVAEGATKAVEATTEPRAAAVARGSEKVLYAMDVAVAVARQPKPAPSDLSALMRRVKTPEFKPVTAPDMGAVAPEPEPVTHLWKFNVVPLAATFTIDEKVVEPMTAASVGVPLTEGVHMLRASSSGAVDFSKRINVTGPGSLGIVLNWKPGRVDVEANVDFALWIDDDKEPKYYFSRKGSFPVIFGSADSTESTKVISLRAAPQKNLAAQQTKKIRVSPNEIEPASFTFSDP